MKRWTIALTALLAVVIGGSAALSRSDSGSRSLLADPAAKCGSYVNSNGEEVPRPCGDWRSDPAPPSGATARCRDGSWSWSQHPLAPGTCSHHGGVQSYR